MQLAPILLLHRGHSRRAPGLGREPRASTHCSPARRRGTGTAWSLRYTRRCGSLWSSSAPLFLVLAETRLQELTSSGPLCFFHCTFIGSRWRMAGGSLAERHDAHQHGGGRAHHADTVAVDSAADAHELKTKRSSPSWVTPTPRSTSAVRWSMSPLSVTLHFGIVASPPVLPVPDG